MRAVLAHAAFFTLVLVLGAGPAHGQLFGERKLGTPLTPRQKPAEAGTSLLDRAVESAGTIDTNARYLRGNRQATDFVGADRGETTGFVGMEQVEVEATVKSAIDTSLNVPTGPDVNRTATVARSPLNAPRLQVGFNVAPRATPGLSLRLTERLVSVLRSRGPSYVEVSVEGRTAIVRGVVASASERNLAETLVMFEPGVSRVQNELVVRQPKP